MPTNYAMRTLTLFAFVCLTATVLQTVQAKEAEFSKAQLTFFEEEVRPLLANRCIKCHGESKQEGELRLDTYDALLKGGESGEAIIPGEPESSLLIEAIQYESLEMPPSRQLNEKEIATLTRWIKLGAPWPGLDGDRPPIKPSSKITAEDRALWCFQPLAAHQPPNVSTEELKEDWARNDIDRFVLHRLRKAGLEPSPEANRATLIRRLYFDLWGLPPTAAEVQAFENDPREDAYEKLVDHLLADRRYGERFAQHWLDLARFAESDGYKQDAFRPDAWRYREYVINAFDADKPYNEFVREQLAGDEIAPQNPEALTATGFLRNTIYEYNQRDVETQRDFMLNELTDVTGEVFLGMGYSCARCHDHKFDPILQVDYFRLKAFFAPLVQKDDQLLPLADPKAWEIWQKRNQEWETKTATIRAEIAKIETPHRESAGQGAANKFPPRVRKMFEKPAEKRSTYEQQIVALSMRQVLPEQAKVDFAKKLEGAEKERWEKLHAELKMFEKEQAPKRPLAYCVADASADAPATKITIPQDAKYDVAELIEPGVLTLLDPKPLAIHPPDTLNSGSLKSAKANSTFRRTALANWITEPSNPLSTRVIVNRVWQYHFGRGLVKTASDFGRLGEPPTHPELLDWLTLRFLEEGWHLKPLHRLILTSATYRQSALTANQAAEKADPQNQLLWRANIRRLDAQQVRDAMFAVTGELRHSTSRTTGAGQGGAGSNWGEPVRSIYTKALRNSHDPLLEAFDSPDRFTSTSERNRTTTATQSLMMMNGSFPLERAKRIASAIAKEQMANRDAITAAYLRVLARKPDTLELEASLRFLNPQQDAVAKPTKTLPIPLAKLSRRGSFDSDASAANFAAKTELLVAEPTTGLPDSDFTVEAIIQLDSIFPDASVRTIAAQWDGNTSHRGWSLGVTSTKSRYEPRNLILQLIGDNTNGDLKYEVIASNLRPELGKAYYVAVSVDLDDTTGQGVTFYMKELGDAKSKLQTARVKHEVVKNYRPNHPFTIGGRFGNSSHRWHGQLDDVRLSARVVGSNSLLVSSELNQAAESAGFWRFAASAPARDDSEQHRLLSYGAKPTLQSARLSALTDLCHVLLNSNEFIYVD